jgi:hypothetical protein
MEHLLSFITTLSWISMIPFPPKHQAEIHLGRKQVAWGRLWTAILIFITTLAWIISKPN